jgi:hypothetical protein
MHPDRRRAGRAIRKQRRQAREVAEAFRLLGLVAEEAARNVGAFIQTIMEAGASIAAGFSRYRGPVWVFQELDAPSLPLGPPAVATSEPGTGAPSHSGGQALRSAPGAIEGMEPHFTIYDEPWGFGEEYGDDAEANESDSPTTDPRG